MNIPMSRRMRRQILPLLTIGVMLGLTYLIWCLPIQNRVQVGHSPPGQTLDLTRYEQTYGIFAWSTREQSLLGGRSDLRVSVAAGAVSLLTTVGLMIAAGLACRWAMRLPGPKGICIECGYDLRGSDSGRCPECGEPGGA